MQYSFLEEARKRIDQQLIDLEKRFLELKAERNTYAPFANLPGDILLEIFEIAKEDVTFPAWYKVIGVCRHWRTVAIGAPTLWMNPPTDKHEMTLLMLERSREASLEISLSNKSSPSTIIALRNHVERIRELAIQQTPLSLRNTEKSFLDRSYPRLEDLSILSTRSVPTRIEAFVLSSVPLCRSSTLRSIRLSLIGFDWNIFPIPNLTHLSLRNIQHTAQISADHLVHILRQMPYLETLFLDPWAFMSRNMPFTGTDASKATLHHLSELQIRVTTLTQARYLLSHLSLPLLDDLVIYCNHVPDTTDSDYSSLFQAIFCAITDGSFGILDSLALFAHDFEIRPSDEAIKYNGVEFTLQADREQDNASHIAKALTGFMAKSSILTRLPRLNLFPLLLLSELLPLCDVMVSVEIIDVSDYAFNTLVMAFLTRAPPDILFPKLQTIILEHYEFDEDPQYLQNFCNVLIARRDYGVPVKEIFLKECKTTEDDLNRLREIVTHVEVEQRRD